MDLATFRNESSVPGVLEYPATESGRTNPLMSAWDIKALENNFEGWRAERVPDLTPSEAFERYAIEAVFRNADLSDEEITSGMMGGGNDGGLDGAYFFLNKRLIMEVTPVPTSPTSADLWLIQAKREKGYTETAVTKMETFVDDLLDFKKDVAAFPIYSQRVKDFIALFRKRLGDNIGSVGELAVHFVYATKSEHDGPVESVKHRVADINPTIHKHLSSAKVSFEFWSAKRLLDAWRSQPKATHSLSVTTYLAHGESFVGIARLVDLAAFLTDENGDLRQGFLEPNVRDYQGAAKANKAMKETLEAGATEEFWWLNNGVTILAESCNFGGAKLNVTTPEIVNGLQTSHEVFKYFSKNKGIEDNRTVMVRVIIPPTDQVRRRIVKATNSQTPVNTLSLSANDDIHFDIEELLRLSGLYYDRRKGEHKRKRMPVSQIVSMADMAQAVIAIALRSPDDARARPGKRVESEEGLASVFDTQVSRQLYLTCITIDRAVRNYLRGRSDIPKDETTDIRFYIDTWLGAQMTGKSEATKAELANLAGTCKAALTPAVIEDACNAVRKIYKDAGGNDLAAKGSDMPIKLHKAIKAALFPVSAHGTDSGLSFKECFGLVV